MSASVVALYLLWLLMITTALCIVFVGGSDRRMRPIRKNDAGRIGIEPRCLMNCASSSEVETVQRTARAGISRSGGSFRD
jgi:hypothetical protein